MLAFSVNCKFSERHFLRRIFGEKNLAANSARRNIVSADFWLTKIRRQIRRMAAVDGSTAAVVHREQTVRGYYLHSLAFVINRFY